MLSQPLRPGARVEVWKLEGRTKDRTARETILNTEGWNLHSLARLRPWELALGLLAACPLLLPRLATKPQKQKSPREDGAQSPPERQV